VQHAYRADENGARADAGVTIRTSRCPFANVTAGARGARVSVIPVMPFELVAVGRTLALGRTLRCPRGGALVLTLAHGVMGQRVSACCSGRAATIVARPSIVGARLAQT
jgi:hypothetical protein